MSQKLLIFENLNEYKTEYNAQLKEVKIQNKISTFPSSKFFSITNGTIQLLFFK